jgi:hypothetical protein
MMVKCLAEYCPMKASEQTKAGEDVRKSRITKAQARGSCRSIFVFKLERFVSEAER